MQSFSRLARPVINSSVAIITCYNKLFKSRYLSCCAKNPRFTRVHLLAHALLPAAAAVLCDIAILQYTLGHMILLFKLPTWLFSLAAWPTLFSHRHESKLGRDDTRPSPRG